MIYNLSITYGGLWYFNSDLFENRTINSGNTSIQIHQYLVNDLRKVFSKSQEIFIKDHRKRFPKKDSDSWKILEVAYMGTLSKLYKNLNHQLPEKA